MRLKLFRLGIASIIILVAAEFVAVAADAPAVLKVCGDLAKPQTYSLAELQQLPSTNVIARDHDGAAVEYTGTRLDEVLRRAEAPMGGQLRGPALRKAVVVHAADKYQAVFSLAELDPAMTDKVVLLAWSQNKKPLDAAQGPLRLVIPGEKRHARWVRQVTAIEVVSLDRPAITNAASP